MAEPIGDSDQFVVHRLRAKPVEYTVKIRHFVVGGEWMMGVTVCDLADTERNHISVADDLRRAAEMHEEAPGLCPMCGEIVIERCAAPGCPGPQHG